MGKPQFQKKRKAETDSAAAPAPVDEGEAAFPRGGPSGPSGGAPSAKKPRVDAAGKKGGRGGKKGNADAFDLGGLLAASSAQQGRKYVELLKHKMIHVGMRLWGAVAEISAHSMVIALPHGLRGTVHYTQASDALVDVPPEGADLAKLFALGQLVRAVVIEVRGGADEDDHPTTPAAAGGGGGGAKKAIGLSLRPSRLNEELSIEGLVKGQVLTCSVKSSEDHGYVVLTGVSKTTGFVPRGKVAAGAAELMEGGVADLIVADIDKKKRHVTLSLDPATAALAVTEASEGVGLGSLMPGALVSVKVTAALEDGLSVSFLDFFSGVVDMFHLSEALPTKATLNKVKVGGRAQARILYVDPASKKVALTMSPYLMRGALRTDFPPVGAVTQGTVKRVDPVLGALIELPPAAPGAPPFPGYAHISNISDQKVERMDKALKVGDTVACRVIGYRPLDGLASLSTKPSVVEQEIYSYQQLTPGLRVSGTILTLSESGATVQVAPGLRAAITAPHLSDVGIKQALKKLKVGQKVSGRVFSSDPATRHCHITLRKQLADSKLPLLCSYDEATPGMKAHGIITGVQDYGIFVCFFGGVKGLVRSVECPLPEGQTLEQAYEAGQIVKCRVLGVETTKSGDRKLKLSLRAEGAAAGAGAGGGGEAAASATDPLAAYREGMIVGDVEITEVAADGASFAVKVGGDAHAHGTLETAHLADHLAACDALKDVLQKGDVLTGLVVLSVDRSKSFLRLSRKQSLVRAAAAGALPRTLDELAEGMVVPGYVASVTEDAVYVRFLGSLTGRAGKASIADTFVSDPAQAFTAGQSVRALVTALDAKKGRFTVSLKQSDCAAPNAALLQSLLADLGFVSELQVVHGKAVEAPWETELRIGGVVEGTMLERKPYGTLIDLTLKSGAESDVIGVAFEGSLETELTEGEAARFRILDANRVDGYVYLSTKGDLMPAAAAAVGGATPTSTGKKKAPAPAATPPTPQLEEGSTVTMRVEAHIDHWVVASAPAPAPAAAAPRSLCIFSAQDYNLATDPKTRFPLGAEVTGTVDIAATSDGRTVCHVDLTAAKPAKAKKPSGGAPREAVEKTPQVQAGKVVTAHVTAAHPLHCDLKLVPYGKGRLHLTEMAEGTTPAGLAALPGAAGDKQHPTVQVAILGPIAGPDNRGLYECSTRAETLAAAAAGSALAPPPALSSFKPGARVRGFVQETAGDFVWVALSPSVRGRVHVLDMGATVTEVRAAARGLEKGTPLDLTVAAVDASRKTVDLVLSSAGAASGAEGGGAGGGNGGDEKKKKKGGKGAPVSSSVGAPVALNATRALVEGSLVMGRVSAMSAGEGLRVALGPKAAGRVALIDLHDVFMAAPTASFKEGSFVRARVLKVQTEGLTHKIDLSLRPSLGGEADPPAPRPKPSDDFPLVPASLALPSLAPGNPLGGFVKHASAKGIFVAVARGVDARIQLSHLSDVQLEDPVAKFPPGTFVKGRVLSVDGARLELTLRSNVSSGSWRTLDQLRAGEILAGKIKRVEKFGCFVALEGTPLSGLAHISECADEFIKDLGEKFTVGDRVKAKVLSVDVQTQRIALSLKPSALEGEGGEGAEGDSDIEGQMADELENEMQIDDDEGAADSDSEDMLGDADQDEDGGADSDSDEGEDFDALAMDVDDADDSEEDEEKDQPPASKSGKTDDAKSKAAKSAPAAAPASFAAVAAALQKGIAAMEAAEEEEEEEEGGEKEEEEGDDGGKGPRVSKAMKKRQREEHERTIREAERARLAGDQAPTSPTDFERLLVASPNSSYIWIQFMAYYLQLGEVDAARKIAEKALQSIAYREEGEKLNVWVAYLNLESLYGQPDPTESLAKLFQRAQQYTDPKKLFLAMVGVCERTDKQELAQSVLKTMCRKFGGSCKVWGRHLAYWVKRGDGEEARRVMERAVQALPKRKHVKFLSQAALTEFRVGNAERGRGVFESVLRNFPKRLDLWSVYLDQEIRQGEPTRIRALFERATSQLLPPKRMKFLFKRYLDYEREFGDEESVDAVKRKAMEFVQSAVAGTQGGVGDDE